MTSPVRTFVRRAVSLPARSVIFLIQLYRTYVSPFRMPTCRFTPTCSEYAVDALRERGALIGSILAVVRLLKCAPWHPGGWDPVPPRRKTTLEPEVDEACPQSPAHRTKLARSPMPSEGGRT